MMEARDKERAWDVLLWRQFAKADPSNLLLFHLHLPRTPSYLIQYYYCDVEPAAGPSSLTRQFQAHFHGGRYGRHQKPRTSAHPGFNVTDNTLDAHQLHPPRDIKPTRSSPSAMYRLGS